MQRGAFFLWLFGSHDQAAVSRAQHPIDGLGGEVGQVAEIDDEFGSITNALESAMEKIDSFFEETMGNFFGEQEAEIEAD